MFVRYNSTNYMLLHQFFNFDDNVIFCGIAQFFLDDPNLKFDSFAYSEYPEERSIEFIKEMDKTYIHYNCLYEYLKGKHFVLLKIHIKKKLCFQLFLHWIFSIKEISMSAIHNSEFDSFIYQKKYQETYDFFFVTRTFGISQPYFSNILNLNSLCYQICNLFNKTFNTWSCEEEEVTLKVILKKKHNYFIKFLFYLLF